MKNKLVELVNVSKSFGSTKVLDELCLEVKENEFLTLLGPSGCGKTTTLRIIGGFERPDSGKVLFDGTDITNVPANKRNLNTVFQKYALFTHMNIADNIAFGLKIKNKSKQYIYDKIKYALKLGDGPLTNGLENVHFVHNCLPELNPQDIVLSSQFGGIFFLSPFLINAVTGGADAVTEINSRLARAAKKAGAAIAVGSQYGSVKNKTNYQSYELSLIHI